MHRAISLLCSIRALFRVVPPVFRGRWFHVLLTPPVLPDDCLAMEWHTVTILTPCSAFGSLLKYSWVERTGRAPQGYVGSRSEGDEASISSIFMSRCGLFTQGSWHEPCFDFSGLHPISVSSLSNSSHLCLVLFDLT